MNSLGDHRDEIHISSSESEISYSADSGIQTTANVTPTPAISLELDQIHHHGKIHKTDSEPLTSPSPISVDQSETWREILQSKVEEQDAVS